MTFVLRKRYHTPPLHPLAACAPAYYLAGDGTCAACPLSPSLWTKYSGVFILVATVSGFAVFVYLILLTAVLAAGLSAHGVVKVGASLMRALVPGLSHICVFVLSSSSHTVPQDVLTLLVHLLTIIQVRRGVGQHSSNQPTGPARIEFRRFSAVSHKMAPVASLKRCACFIGALGSCSLRVSRYLQRVLMATPFRLM